ncbi:MAG TPA: TIM barrel protein [Atribacteraceae bacterium]|nr:TIM barrel protein [Atribacteraceae bacterium]
MFELSVCFEPLFEGKTDVEKIRLIHELGYSAVEFWDLADKDLTGIAEFCGQNNMSVGICTLQDPWGNNRLHADTDDYIRHFSASLDLLNAVGSQKVIVLTGEDDGRGLDVQINRIIANLKAVSGIAEEAGVTICLEALNSRVNHKGYLLDSSTLGFDIVRRVNSPSVKLLFDIYHMQIMEGNIISTIRENIDLIGHFHSAGVPGRNEHFLGELNYPNIFRAIRDTGYGGYFGLEYWPTMDDRESLERVRRHFLD